MDRTGRTPGSGIVNRPGFRYQVYGVAGFGRLAVPIAPHMPFFVLLLAGQPVAEMPWNTGMILPRNPVPYSGSDSIYSIMSGI